MQFIIQMADPFTVLGLFSLNISYGLSIANGGHYSFSQHSEQRWRRPHFEKKTNLNLFSVKI